MSATAVAGVAAAPYRGLASFTEADEDAFFGRDADVALIAANVLASRLTVLYGPSGTGKTSLVRAGVVHRLRRSGPPPGSSAPRLVVAVVGDWLRGAPADAVLEAVRREAGDEAPVAGTLTDALAALCERQGMEVMLCFDQFEDHLLAPLDPDRAAFDRDLVSIVSDLRLPVQVLVSLREDAVAALDRYKGRLPNLFEVSYRLGGLAERDAVAAIAEPLARHARLTGGDAGAEPGLPERVVADLAGDGRVEPVHLQLVMTRLWEAELAQGSDTLRVRTLEELGGAQAIVQDHLGAVMRRMPPGDRAVAADILTFLAPPSGGTTRLTAADLADPAYTGRGEAEVAAVLEELAGSARRVLRAVPAPPGSSGATAYELFHQTLAAPARDWSRAQTTATLEQRTARLGAAVVALVAVMAGMALYLANPPALQRVELDTIDARFAVRGDQGPDPDVVVVSIDQPSVERDVHARAIEAMAGAGPRAIVYDVVFPPGFAGSPAQNAALKAAIREHRRRLVMATPGGQVHYDARGRTVLRSAPLVTPGFSVTWREGAGIAQAPLDVDGRVRRFEYRFEVGKGADGATLHYPTMAWAASRRAGVRLDVTALPGASRFGEGGDAAAGTWIDYRGGPGTLDTVAFRDVVAGRVPADALRDKVLVVGRTGAAAAEQGDVQPTVTGEPMSGVEIQANAVSTLLRGAPLRDAATVVDELLILLLGAVPLGFWLLRLPRWRLLGPLAAAVVFLVLAQLAFNGGDVVAVAAPLVALLLSAAGIAAVEGRRALRRAG